MSALGVIAGLAGSTALTRVLAKFLYGAGANEPVVIAVAALSLLMLRVAAAALPRLGRFASIRRSRLRRE